MSYFDDASLVMIPSGYKTSKVYSVKPTDGSGDLTFSRSNDTATRVNSAGLIEKVRTNLATYSEQLNNTSGWGFEQLAVTANAVANPLDGAVTADKIYATVTGSSVPILKQTTAATANQTITVSGYFKKAEYDYVVIHGFGLGGTVFNLAAGTKSGDGTITSVGNGWYRCAAVLAMSGDARIFITPSVDGNVGYTSTANSGVYAFGMQFELGDVATDYIATTSSAVSVGPVANVPRLDYLGSSCPRLLLEPQRTNLNPYSEQFNNADWEKTFSTITANATTSPDGYTNADAWFETSDNNWHRLYDNGISVTSGTAYTCSLFVKPNGRNWVSIEFFAGGGGFNGSRVWFNIANGTIGTTQTGITAKIENYGNGWYRISATQTAAASTTGYILYLLATGDGVVTYAGDPTKGAYVYGGMTEAGAYATSYIPTLGAAVTRGVDLAQKTSASALIGQTEGTIYWEFQVDTPSATGHEQILNIDNGSFGNTIYIFKGSTAGIVAEMYNGSVAQAAFSISNRPAGTYKAAFAYATNNTAFFLNGVQVGTTDTSCSVPAMSRIQLGNTVLGPSTDKTAQVLLFPTRLSNADLAALTA